MIFFDFEVFKHDWLVFFADAENQTETVIVNNREELLGFYNENQKRVFIGYNVRNYDQWIFKSILCGFNPKEVNDFIILKNRKGWEFSNQLRNFDLILFDLFQNTDRGLKFFEGSMGNNIKETGVSFDIDRKLTDEEIQETIRYCQHDVQQTIEIFLHRKSDFDAQLGLVKMFNLPLSDLGKTKPQLSAKVLKASRQKYNDEFDIDLPDTLKIKKYVDVVEWYKNPSNRKYRENPDNEKSKKHQLNVDIAGVPHVFGWGGVHGAREKYHGKGYFINMDVASLYPALIIRYGLMSRNVSNPDKYREIRDLRIEYKAAKNPLQAPLKIVLNSTYGAMKDVYNPLYDPLQANRVCVYGQLLLLDLMERLEEIGAELIQSNTDGILVKMPEAASPDEFFETVDDVAYEWEQRTGLELEFDEFKEIYQKDVNNYVMVAFDGSYKSKGAYVKKLGALDYDLAVVNRAIVKYMVEGVPVQETITNCSSLRDFQMIARASSKYNCLLHGEKRLNEKTVRVFASADVLDAGLTKIHAATGKPAKCAGTPEHCFIMNDNISDAALPPNLSFDWYIDLALKRLKDFGIKT